MQTLRRPQVRQLVLLCDKDGSGTVSIEELTWLLTKPPTHAPEDFRFSDAPDVRQWLQDEFQVPWRSGEDVILGQPVVQYAKEPDAGVSDLHYLHADGNADRYLLRRFQPDVS